MKDGKKLIFYRCKLDGKYISERASNMHNPDFESGAVKIQSGKTKKLTRAEKATVRSLKRPDPFSDSQGFDNQETPHSSTGDDICARLAKLRKMEGKNQDEIINCDFILGSVALIKSLWSTAKFISTDFRSRISPHFKPCFS